MRKDILVKLTMFICILFIAVISGDSWAGTSSADFKVTSRGAINYTVVVTPNTKSLNITVSKQSQHLQLEVTPPDTEYVACSTTTWTSSVGLKNPLNCGFSNPKPGEWKIKITGAVHVGSVDKYPHVTGNLTVNTGNGKHKLSGPGTK